MKNQWIAAALVAARRDERRAGAGLSDAHGDGDRAVRGRRTGRHHRPHRGRHLLAPSRPAVRGRERRRRRRHGRHDCAPRAPRPTATRSISGHMGTNALAPVFYPNLGYDPEKDFEPVGLIAEQPELLAVRKDIPGQQPQGVRRLRQGEREQAQHGACRRRLGVLYRLPAAQQRHRHQADAGAVHRHRAGDERHPRRPGRLRLRPGARARCRMCAPARSRRSPSPPRSAARCCRTCRPPTSRACRSSTARRSTRCSRRKARRRRSSTSSPTRSSKGLDEPAVQKRLDEPRRRRSPSRTGADRRRSPSWCTARSRG